MVQLALGLLGNGTGTFQPAVSLSAAKRIMVPIRGGPHAALAFKLATGLAERVDGTVTALVEGIVPATLTPFIDLNYNAQLGRFGLHNGEPNDRNNLSEKWEGMALAPVLDPDNPKDYFLFITNDNDFITQNGYQVSAAYKDASNVDVDTMILVYRITLP
jgi:hypothetical protein